jgi:hypothetical protein
MATRHLKFAIIIRLLGSTLMVHNSQLNPVDQLIKFSPTSDTSCHIVCVSLETGFWLVNRFIDHLNTHDMELQAVIVPSLISTPYSSVEYTA